jgi:regulator of nucleoside diphosphate kinase
MKKSITITQSDAALLNTLFTHEDAVSPLDVQQREAFAARLQDATVIPDNKKTSAPIAGLLDLVKVEDLSSSPPDAFDFTLVLPHEANFEDDHISVLSPLGSAVFGRSSGSTVTLESPDGARKMRLVDVCKKGRDTLAARQSDAAP